jgi:hypothetical protein
MRSGKGSSIVDSEGELNELYYKNIKILLRPLVALKGGGAAYYVTVLVTLKQTGKHHTNHHLPQLKYVS